MVREDEEVSAYAKQALEADGVTVLTGHKALRCEQRAATSRPSWSKRPAARSASSSTRCCARSAGSRVSKGYGLEELGIPAQRTIETNEYLQTIYPNIYACGDVAGPFQFTHTASHQAWYAAVNALFGGSPRSSRPTTR